MNFRKKCQEEFTVDLTALIDVVFLLLIFFMVTTTFEEKKEIQVNLPESQQASALGQATLTLLIDKEGNFYQEQGSQQQALGNTRNEIENFLKNQTALAKLRLHLKADKQAPYQSVVFAMDAAKAAQVAELLIVTDTP
jgi:biopolymer transport protein ExbD